MSHMPSLTDLLSLKVGKRWGHEIEKRNKENVYNALLALPISRFFMISGRTNSITVFASGRDKFLALAVLPTKFGKSFCYYRVPQVFDCLLENG